jgi:hypothetical protein
MEYLFLAVKKELRYHRRMSKATKRRPGPGRPPSGPTGERVSEYATLTVRLPADTRQQLHGLSVLKRVPVWRLVDQAVTALVATLPADERRLMAQLAAKMDRE